MGYTQKIVYTDTLVRIYQYKNPVPSGFKANRDEYIKELHGLKSDKSLKRAKDDLAITIAANVTKSSKFFTITVKDNITDRNEFLKMFKRFKQRATRYLGKKLEYVAVTETQKRGAWHIHMIVFNVPEFLDLKEFNEKTFPEGNVNVKQVREYWELFKYLTKYLTKEELSLNKKAVLKSRGLKQAVTEIGYSELELDAKDCDYHSSYIFYHGTDENGIPDVTKMNECKIYEFHLKKQ